MKILLALLFLPGCCSYNGKLVSRAQAKVMRDLGMDVTCCGKEP